MAGLTNYGETKVLDHLFGATTYTAPATWYIALYTTAPNQETGASGVEVTGGSYARAAVTNNTTNFPNATAGDPSTKSNGTAITFATPSASWGTVVAYALCDASTAGNIVATNNLTTSKTINSGDSVSFPIGQLVFTLD